VKKRRKRKQNIDGKNLVPFSSEVAIMKQKQEEKEMSLY
jgi:hypothetical protein